MKTLITSLFIFFCLSVRSQGLTQSTIGQIYDFQPGDTMEYNTYNYPQGLLGINEYSYIMEIILTRVDTNGYIIYNVYNHIVSGYAAGYSYSPTLFDSTYSRLSYNNLDSPIFFYHTYMQGCDTITHFCYNDTVTVDSSSYFGRKKDLHSEGNPVCCVNDSNFVNGLGEVSGGYAQEDYDGQQDGFGLIYYHKISGETWGNPYYIFAPDGVKSIDNANISVAVIPNPTTSDFQIKINNTPAGQMVFNLYDETGRSVMHRTITGSNTQMSRDGIADGLYIWSLSSDGIELSHGKIVFK